ncbi:sugar transporter ERD6-like 7 isoform X2 [Eucalyptus grandis]|uniref:sugar transporter ERD6-like 7 isoform X2 n=1 Tax=Eucalyptus grandis TaxID=71139 RepID=UPI00192F016D|nr:sugar transporter ERD6-like 7 isoform X2 [Eucalyptus grandis]
MAINEDIENQETGDRGVRERLLVPQEKDRAGKDEGTDKGRLWMVYFTTFVAVCGSYELGTCAGYSSPTQDAIVEELSLSTAENSVVQDSLRVLALGFSHIMDGGRDSKNICLKMQTMRIASALCVAGWLAIYFAEGALALDIRRLATGYGMGVFSYVLMIVAGVSVSFIIGTVLAWRVLALIGLIPCAVLLFGLFFTPESPRWLAKTSREKEFEAALQKLRGKDADISEEAAEIQDYIETLQLLLKANILDLFQRRYLSSVIIGVGLMVVQQFGGINGVCFYTSNIFEEAGFSSSVGTITYAILQVIATAIVAALVDRAGRKPLLLISGTGLVLGCIVTALSFFLKVHDLAADAVPILAVTGILHFRLEWAQFLGS